MNNPAIPPHPQHREKLLDLSTGKTVNIGEGVLNLRESATPLAEASAEAASPEAALHVSPIGENWEVESATGTLGQADSKAEAENLATELAVERGVAKIAVHGSDGAVEKEIVTNTRKEERGEQTKRPQPDQIANSDEGPSGL